MDIRTEKKKKLLNASFSEAKNIVWNLFGKKQFWYDPTTFEDNPGLWSRITNIIAWIFFSVPLYGLGVFFPEQTDFSSVSFGLKDVFFGLTYFTFLKYPIIICIIVFGILILINIFPKPNFVITRIIVVGNLLVLTLLSVFGLAPFLLGITLGSVGWYGFIILTIYGIIFFVKSLISKFNSIKCEMYGETYKFSSSKIDIIWKYLKKIWLVPLTLIVVNIITFRIGMWGGFNLLSFLLMSFGVGYFGYVTLFIVGPMKMYISTYYFVKYSKQFRELWKSTDEQWYGPKKAKKMRKKQLKLDKKNKGKNNK